MSEYDDGWPCWSFSNHDVERVASRWSPIGEQLGYSSPEFLRLLMAMLLTIRGSIYVYQGEELGLPEAELRQEDLRDPFGIAFWPDYKGRDGSRTPMPWASETRHLSFSDAKPWLPLPETHRELAVEAQAQDATSTLNVWRDFLQFRRSHPALAQGALHMVETAEPVVAFRRVLDGETLLCVFNLSSERQVLELPHHDLLEPVWNSGSRISADVRRQTVELGCCGVIICRVVFCSD
jgi:alpha-glucosidase